MAFPASNIQPGAADTTNPGRYPSWVILDKRAYCLDRENATTAEAIASTGLPIRVTFCLADPPSISHFCVHSPGFDPDNYTCKPSVVSSARDLVLLRFAFSVGPRNTYIDPYSAEYFIYRAGREPTLTPIPVTPRGTRNTFNVAIVPCDDDSFFLADLSDGTTHGYYDLKIFSSKNGKWTTMTLWLQTSTQVRKEDLFLTHHKVIEIGKGVVGWVDLWRGIIICHLEEPLIYFIPLPKPGFNLCRKGDPKPTRDVTFFNGVLKFVEIEHYFRREVIIHNNYSTRFKMTKDLDSVDVIYDTELLLLPDEDRPASPVEEIKYVPDGWKIRTCYRRLSWDNWRRGHNIHVDDILVNKPSHSVLAPQLWDGSARKSTLRNLTAASPTFSIHGDDIVCLMSKVDFYDKNKNAWMVGVDLGKKTVEMLEPYIGGRLSYYDLECLACAFSGFLNTTFLPRFSPVLDRPAATEDTCFTSIVDEESARKRRKLE